MHLWCHVDRAAPGGDLGPEHLAVLGPDEQVRLAELTDPRRRRQFVLGRVLCRNVLSRYAPVPASAWRFAVGPRGKPAIAAPVLAAPLWFNLSHADGLTVMAVTGVGPRIGVDVEALSAGRDGLSVAEQFFARAEVEELAQLPETRREARFIRIWAAKESVAKARECSLAEVLDRTTVDGMRHGRVGLHFDPALGERPERWWCRLFELEQRWILALAVADRPGPLEVSVADLTDRDLAG